MRYCGSEFFRSSGRTTIIGSMATKLTADELRERLDANPRFREAGKSGAGIVIVGAKPEKPGPLRT